ncbi:hypothetical protein [Oceanobacillus sp. FSL H7-0719]|uniref:hypothetical protein n=1 Tax=Oceanobacillus sp. FSL H7-0719 TaxID=2954507 RepID=UPI003247D679
MKTSYDLLWSTFLAKCKVDDLDLPNSEEAIYDTIQNAVLAFNNKLEDDLLADNTTELLNRELSGDELLLLSHCIRIIILENQLIYFSASFSPFTKEIGARNLGNQMNRLEYLIDREDDKIHSIIVKMTDDFI